MNNMMGEQLQLFIGEGTSAHTLACATSCSINVNADSIDTSCKDTGKFGSSIRGKISWDISTDCLFTVSDYNELMKALIDGTPLTATWASVSNYDAANAAGGDDDGHVFNSTTKAVSADDLWYGKVVLTSCSLTADNGSLATYSVSASGMGALTQGGKANVVTGD